jgi:hypothetical protein
MAALRVVDYPTLDVADGGNPELIGKRRSELLAAGQLPDPCSRCDSPI